MIGIVSYGGYIPRLRLNRMSIYQSIGCIIKAHRCQLKIVLSKTRFCFYGFK